MAYRAAREKNTPRFGNRALSSFMGQGASTAKRMLHCRGILCIYGLSHATHTRALPADCARGLSDGAVFPCLGTVLYMGHHATL